MLKKSHLFFAVFFILITGLLVTTAFATGEIRAADSSYLEIEDRAGRQVEVPGEPENIIVVGSGALRNVLYFESPEIIAGVEEGETAPDEELYRDYQLANEELREKPEVGPHHGGDTELIAAREPDLVIHSGDAGDAADLQSQIGIPVVYLDFGDLHKYRDTLFADWKILGEIFGAEGRAEELIDFTEGLIDDLESRTADISPEDRPEVYVGGQSHRGGHGITSVRVPFPPFEFTNVNHVAEKELDYDTVTQANIDREQLLYWDPEYIFLDSSNLDLIEEDISRHAEYSHLEAIQEERVFTLLPFSSYHRQFSNILANAYFTGSIVYPEEFEDIDAEAKAREIMEEFLGEPVLAGQREHFTIFEQIDLLEE